MKLQFRFKPKNIKCSWVEWNKIYNSLDQNKYVEKHFDFNNIPFNALNFGEWIQAEIGDRAYIITATESGYVRYITNLVDDNKNQHYEENALRVFKSKFEELENKSFRKTFHEFPDKRIKACVPKQLYFSSDKEYQGFMTILDYTAHYPASLCGSLPDASTAVKKSGVYKPTKEYPFAFYLKSGHIAIYNEFDSHDWIMSNYCDNLFRWRAIDKDAEQYPYLKHKEDITILMKAADTTLNKTIEYFFDLRTKEEKYKLIMNKAIGQMHTKAYTQDRYAHLVAVCIARANNKMINLLKNFNRAQLLQVQVDGIIIKGTCPFGNENEKKSLGTLMCPYRNESGYWMKIGSYMIMRNSRIVYCKHQGYNATSNGSDIDHPDAYSDAKFWITLLPQLKEIQNG